jgi:tRNA threonylcarbamoyladenosine biosynthesis protein TsaB
MRVLALDTTTRVASMALVEDQRVIEERVGDPSQPHSERLPAALIELLHDHGMTPASVDVFAVAAGPGSFTGVRIGMAIVQGLAMVTGRRVVGVSALEALAQLASRTLGPGALVGALIDAHRGEVFSALYQVAEAPLFSPERLVELAGPLVGEPAATLASWPRREAMSLVGDGAGRAVRLGGVNAVAQAPALAGAIGRMAIVRASRGEAVHPAAVRPLYIRRPDAELEREKSARLAERTHD